jgi:flagellar hook protein FlgE
LSFELPARVSGFQDPPKTSDIAENMPVNVNSAAFKSGKITFSDLLSETIEKTSQPTTNRTPSNLINTGNPLDLAIEGEGYLVLNDGIQNLYTRSGTFAIDTGSNLVDRTTGYAVQRIGSTGENDGFQIPRNSNVRIPYNAVIPANSSTEVKVWGNLSSDATLAGGPQTNLIASNMAYTISGATAGTATEIDQLDQFSGGSGKGGQLKVGESGRITISGFNPDGIAFSSGLTFTINSGTTLGDFINYLNNQVLSGATASLVNGKIQITDDSSGYSKMDVTLSYSGDGSLTTPSFFEILTAGGEEVKNVGITIYDSQGAKHVLNGAFVRTNTLNTWDMVLSSVSGNVSEITMANRRIENISFNADDGSYAGLIGSDSPRFVITFAHDASNPQAIEIQMGTVSKLDGLTQFKGSTTAAASEQNGYGAGRLSNISVNNEGTIIGTFSNGIKKNIARLQVALFENTSGLENIGSGYFIPTANSSKAMAVGAMKKGAGTIHGGALEKSNADVTTEFTKITQAKNGFQVNARTIRIANEILREMSNLMS